MLSVRGQRCCRRFDGRPDGRVSPCCPRPPVWEPLPLAPLDLTQFIFFKKIIKQNESHFSLSLFLSLLLVHGNYIPRFMANHHTILSALSFLSLWLCCENNPFWQAEGNSNDLWLTTFSLSLSLPQSPQALVPELMGSSPSHTRTHTKCFTFHGVDRGICRSHSQVMLFVVFSGSKGSGRQGSRRSFGVRQYIETAVFFCHLIQSAPNRNIRRHVFYLQSFHILTILSRDEREATQRMALLHVRLLT